MKVHISMLAVGAVLGGGALAMGCLQDGSPEENTGRVTSAVCDGEDEYMEGGTWVVCVYPDDDPPIDPDPWPPWNWPPEPEEPEPPSPPDPSGGGGEPPVEPEPTACSVTLHSCDPWNCVDNGQCTADQKQSKCDEYSRNNCGPIDHCRHCQQQLTACENACPNPPPPGGSMCGIICALEWNVCTGDLTVQQCPPP